MILWGLRLLPLVLWLAYLATYAQVQDALGAYARIIGLALVAASGWTWGVVGGVIAGVVGFMALELRSSGSFDVGHLISYSLASERVFEVLAFVGTGLGVGFLQKIKRTLMRERALSKRAQVDPLTGAYTRAAFEERLSVLLERAKESNETLALLFVDLDRFKFVNDTYGHDMGDKLLREVGRIVRQSVRGDDLVGRVGGDEFTVALVNVKDERAAAAVAKGLVKELNAPIVIEGRELQVSASIGIGLYPRDGLDPESLLQSADAAMYQVKEGGKNAFVFSTIEVRTRLSRRLELERQLRRAITENQLEVAYQPQVQLSDGQLVAFEALLRWRSPELGLVPPGEFVPVAEEAGMIAPIGHWVLREAALQQREWIRQGLSPVRIAVNVSTVQFHQATFVDTVKGALADSGIAPHLLEIEVTESVLVRDYHLALRTLAKLERLGVPTALDDFGTGYSSLAYLQKLPIKTLKIDRSFIQSLQPHPLEASIHSTDSGSFGHIGHGGGHGSSHVSSYSGLDPYDTGSRRISTSGITTSSGVAEVIRHPSPGPIIEAICAMAHKLDKLVVAEGIETAYQRDFLRRLGVDLAQGYFFARPMQPAQAESLLRRVTQESRTKGRLQQEAPVVPEKDAFSDLHMFQQRPSSDLDELLLTE